MNIILYVLKLSSIPMVQCSLINNLTGAVYIIPNEDCLGLYTVKDMMT